MPSLPQVLHEAATRNATEVVIESGQIPMVRTDAGSVTVGEVLSESELFDALAQVLGPDQQAELAVGNVVSFELEIDSGTWSMITEPSIDGIVVRGRSSGTAALDATGTPLELPKLDPMVPTRSSAVPQTASPISSQKRSTQWDIGVPDAPQDESPPPAAPPAPPSTPGWSRHFDPSLESDFEIRTPTGEAPANLVDAQDEVREEPLPELITPAPVESDWDDQPDTISVAPPPSPSPLHGKQVDGGGLMRPSAERDPVRMPPPRAQSATTLESFAGAVTPGTLCLVQGESGEQLAMSLEGGDFALIDDADPTGVLDAAAQLEPGGRFVVRVEDPSACLGWILRRLEEGARVVVETRARTAAGARRILLGTDASVRTEAWLDAHQLLWFARDLDGWIRQTY